MQRGFIHYNTPRDGSCHWSLQITKAAFFGNVASVLPCSQRNRVRLDPCSKPKLDTVGDFLSCQFPETTRNNALHVRRQYIYIYIYIYIYMLIKIQPDATVCRYLFTAKSLYMFRVSQHPSSGVLKTVTASSGTGHNIGTANSLQRGLIGTGLCESCGRYSPDHATMEGSSCTSIMTCTRGCGYSF